ncbi:MAG TPA: hypothetical protein VGL38_03900 [bacterium]
MTEKKKVAGAREKFATYLQPETIEKIRRAAFHTGLTTGEIIEGAVTGHVAKLEKKAGKSFGPITRLRTGRPISASK